MLDAFQSLQQDVQRRAMRKTWTSVVGTIFTGLITVAITAAVAGIFTLLLWNWLCPEIFGLPKIGFLQAWGLCALGNIMFNMGRNKR